MKSASRRGCAIAAAVAVACLISACSSSGGSSGGSHANGTSSGKQSLTTVRVSMLAPLSSGGFVDMGQEKGFYKDCGVNLKVIQMTSGQQQTPALISGSVDIDIESPQQMLLATQKGVLKAKVVGAVMPGLPWAIYGGKGVTSLEDLKGKAIATSTTTSLNTIVASLILKKHGIDPSTIKWVNAGSNADKFKAVVNGVTQGASAPSDFIPEAKKDGVNVLATAAQDAPEYPRWTVITTDKYLADHGDAVTCYLEGMIKGERYAFDHPDEAKALAAKDMGGSTKPDDTVVTNMYQQIVNDKLINRNGEIPTSKLEFQQQTLIDLGLLKQKIPLDQVYTDKYRQAAVKALGGPQN